MKQPIKMTPGDDTHLSLLMAPYSLNLVTGQDRRHLLGYGRSAFEAGKASQCLHQIQEPEADIWPCVNIDVDASGKITNAKLYSPGLPAGNHDVYPVRVPYMDEHTEAWHACVDELEKAVPGFMSLGNMNGIECAVAAIRGLSERAKHQEPAAAEQAAWHAGLDEGRAQATGSVSNATSQAAPAAVNPSETPNSSTIAVPSGWKLVPDDATPEWVENLEALPDWRDAVGECIKKFLAASPVAPQAAPAAVAVPEKLPTGDVIRAIARSVSTSSSDSPSSSEYVMAGYRAALAATPAAAPTYIEVRECSDCGHIGINDADGSKAACSKCDWQGDSPVEDKCPNCNTVGTMTAACSKCGARASLLAETTLHAEPIAAAAAPVVLPETDAAISEVMELVRAFGDARCSDAGVDFDGADSAKWREAIKSKLRTLLAQAATAGIPAQTQQPDGFVPAAAFDRLQALCDSQAARILAAEDAEPVHWRAVLDPEQVPQQLKASLHAVGFRDQKAAEAWIASELDFNGWRYTLEPLYAAPQAATGLPAQADTPDSFREWFAKNYPADTIIVDPDWHAKSIFRMAQAHARLAAPQAQADAKDDSALLDAMEQQRIAVVPEYEGPWDAEVYNGDEKPNHHGTGATPREAIRAAIAAAKGD